MSSSPKPSSPPPAYTEIDPQASSSAAPPTPAPAAAIAAPYGPHPGPPTRMDSQFSSAPAFPTHAGYGPTNIIQQSSHILPYYDPRSPYSLAEATSRARWRFVGAVCWAVLILTMMSLVTGWEIDVHDHPWNGDYWRRMARGNGDEWSSS